MGQQTLLDNLLPFTVLILPLAGFVVLALFGDWIKRDKEDSGAAWLACGTVITAFALAVWTTLRLFSQPPDAEEWQDDVTHAPCEGDPGLGQQRGHDGRLRRRKRRWRRGY